MGSNNINEYEFSNFSQNGEDGIIDYLLYSLNIDVPKFLEIGVGNYKESNTRYLFEKFMKLIDTFKTKNAYAKTK